MIDPKIASQVDRNRAVDAVEAIVRDGFAVGCCLMSETDGHEFAAYLSDDFARHRIAALADNQALLREAVDWLRTHIAEVDADNAYWGGPHKREYLSAPEILTKLTAAMAQVEGEG